MYEAQYAKFFHHLGKKKIKIKAPEKSMNCQEAGWELQSYPICLTKGLLHQVTYKLEAHITAEGKVICCNHF